MKFHKQKVERWLCLEVFHETEMMRMGRDHCQERDASHCHDPGPGQETDLDHPGGGGATVPGGLGAGAGAGDTPDQEADPGQDHTMVTDFTLEVKMKNRIKMVFFLQFHLQIWIKNAGNQI